MNYFLLTAKLNSLYAQFRGQSVSIRRLLNSINKTIPFDECRVVAKPAASVGGVHIEGTYDPRLDQVGKPSIEIQFKFNRNRKAFTFSDRDVSEIKWFSTVSDIASILGHEYIHLHQHRRRSWRLCRHRLLLDGSDISYAKNYFGKPDEVDAYAFNVAIELTHSLPKRASIQSSNVYAVYREIFKKTDPVILRLEKLTNKYFNRLEKQYYETIRRVL